jgi:hypothetical protein
MERDTKIVLSLIGLTVGVLGVSYLWNINQKPKIESYDNINKTVTYTFRGSKKTEKLDPSMATKIGRYSIIPMLDAKKQVMGVEIKDYDGSVIDSMYTTPSESVDVSKVASATVGALKKTLDDASSKKQANGNSPSSSEPMVENSRPIFPILSPPQVGAKEWNNIRKLALLLDKKTGKQSWITRASADANTNKKLYNNFRNYVTYDEYLSIGKFLGTYKGNESKTLASFSAKEKQLLSSGMNKIRANSSLGGS